MNRLTGSVFFAAVCCLWAVAACSRPVSEERFVKASRTDAYGRYVFPLDLSDTTCRYDVGLYAVLDVEDPDFEAFSHLPLDILWESPSGRPFWEEVAVGRDCLVDSKYYEKSFRTAYRTDLVPVEPGIWRLSVSVPEADSWQGSMVGIGVKLVRKTGWDTEN